MDALTNIHWWLFPVGIILDLIWVLWMNAVAKDWAWRAGWWGMMTAAVGLYATIDIVHDYQHAIPYLGGLFFGSALGVRLKRKKIEVVPSNLPEYPLGKPSSGTLEVMLVACPRGPFKKHLESELDDDNQTTT